MLMQNFQSAADLGISEAQKEALMKTLVLLETGKLVHVQLPGKYALAPVGAEFSGRFNMGAYVDADDCGTIACIAGTAQLISGVSMHHPRPPQMWDLFYGGDLKIDLQQISPAQAARALRSYLTTGDAKWTEAVSVAE